MSLQSKFFYKVFAFLFLASTSLAYSKSHSHESYFLIYSSPKTGSHLLNKAVELLTSKSVCMSQEHETVSETEQLYNLISDFHKHNKIIHTHRLPPGTVLDLLYLNKVKMMSILRDPRDQLISLIFHHHKCGTYLDDCIVSLPDPNESLTNEDIHYLLDVILLHNIWPYKSYHHVINDCFALQYLPKKQTLLIKFEDLVGPNGGGTLDAQVECLTKLCKFLNIPYSKSKIDYVIDNLFGGTWSFRNGKIGDWKTYFSLEHKAAFQEKYRYWNVLHDYSYE